MTFDVVIANGRVVDGTGTRAPYAADIGVRGDVVATIAPPGTLDGRTVIDARDRLVTPGFIDIHTHYDAQVLWDPTLSPTCHQGVTTVIGGNCGFTLAPCKPEHRGIVIDTLESVEDITQTDTLTALGGNILSVGGSTSTSTDPDLNSIFPNPADRHISISYGSRDQSIGTVLIFNSIGQEVRKIVNSSSVGQPFSMDLSTSDLPNGVYSLLLESLAGVVSRSRFVIQH